MILASDLMTDDEHEALRLLGETASLCRKIIGDGPQADHDWNEMAVRFHGVQHMVMRQCAARAFPERYRLLGQTITSQQREVVEMQLPADAGDL